MGRAYGVAFVLDIAGPMSAVGTGEFRSQGKKWSTAAGFSAPILSRFQAREPFLFPVGLLPSAIHIVVGVGRAPFAALPSGKFRVTMIALRIFRSGELTGRTVLVL